MDRPADYDSLFVCGDWHVHPNALVYRPGLAAEYVIEKTDLGCARQDGASFWIMHALETSWIDMEEFTPAFRRALELWGIDTKFDWKKTEAEAFAYVYREFFCAEEADRRLASRSGPADFGALSETLATNFWRPLPISAEPAEKLKRKTILRRK